MVGFTDYVGASVLGWTVGQTAMPMLPTVYVGLFTAVGSDAGTGFTEVSGGGYARKATAGTDWNAAGGTSPSTLTNAAAITFPAATASWGDVVAFGLFDAATAGHLLVWDWLGADAWVPFSASSANPAVITSPYMVITNGGKVAFTDEFGGFTTGLWDPTLLYTAAGVAGGVGSPPTSFNTGDYIGIETYGMVRRVIPQTIPAGVTYSAAPGALTLVIA